MSRVASGAISIVDITDGTDPISAFLTNENHTFSASTSGVIPASELSAFSSAVRVFVGGTEGNYNNFVSSSSNKGDYKITDPSVTSGWDVGVNTTTGALSLSSGGSTNSVQIPVSVTIATGNSTVVVDLSMTLSKATEGGGGEIITLSSNKQTFIFNQAGTALSPTSQPSVVLSYSGSKSAGSTVDFRQIVTNSSDTVAAEVALVAGVARDTVTSASTSFSGNITLEDADFGSNNVYTVKVRIKNGSIIVAEDSISIVKVQRGSEGASSINVSLVSEQGTVFKNSSGTTKVITANIRDASDGSEITHTAQTSVHYDWRVGSTTGTVVRLDSGTRNVRSTGGVPSISGGDTASGTGSSFATIQVGAEDVEDGGEQQFSCVVTVT